VCVSEIGKTVCGAAVGISGSRMCIIEAAACYVAKHQETKVSLNVTTPSASDTYVCIMQRNTKTAFTNLVVSVQLLGSARRLQYLSKTRQHDQWEMLFRGLLAPGGESDETAIRLFEDSTTKRGLAEEQGLTSSFPLKCPKNTQEAMETDKSAYFILHKTNP
jgi:hypothetical protein